MLKHVYQNWNDKLLYYMHLDFSHAFNTIDHSILLRKLEQYGFDDLSISFMSGYHNILQLVDVNQNVNM